MPPAFQNFHPPLIPRNVSPSPSSIRYLIRNLHLHFGIECIDGDQVYPPPSGKATSMKNSYWSKMKCYRISTTNSCRPVQPPHLKRSLQMAEYRKLHRRRPHYCIDKIQ